MSIDDAIQSGNLAEAVTLATDEVKRNPTLVEARIVLAELMCFAGNLDRADSLVEAATKIRGNIAPGLMLYRQLLRGEVARQQWYNEGRAPEVKSEPSEELATSMQVVVDYRAKDYSAAAKSVAKLNESRPLKGTLQLKSGDEVPFEGFRDMSDLSAMVAEFISMMGKFYWVPWSTIKTIKFEPVGQLRDVLWRPLSCVTFAGVEDRFFMPCLYPGSAAAAQEVLRLGQSTDWVSHGDDLVTGLGLRMFLAGDATPTILEINQIQFEPQEAASAG